MPTRSMLKKQKAYKSKTKEKKTDKKDNKDEEEVVPPTLRSEKTEDTLICNLSNPKKSHPLNNAQQQVDRMLMSISHEIEMRTRHALIANFNLGQCPMTCADLCDYPTCKLSVPRPVFITPKHCARVDPCHKRSMARAVYRKRLHIGRTRYETAWNSNRNLRAKEKDQIYHTSLFEFAERLQRNPDPYFHGGYDYYYTGGNMCVLPEEGHLVHVDGDNLQNLNVSHFPLHKDFTEKPLRSLCAQLYEEPSEIFEVRPLRQHRDDRPNCFVVRQRNSITLQAFLPQKTRIKPITSFKSKYTPFISFAQSPCDAHVFLVSTMKQNVRWYDLNGAMPTLRTIYDLNRDTTTPVINWNTIKPWRADTFLYANEEELCLMDGRSTPADWLRYSVENSTKTMNCDFISSLAVSEFSNLLYVGTNHKLHCFDVRYLGTAATSERATVCTWTHQLDYAPAFVETFRNVNSEFIALSSPVAGDLRLCELTRERNIVEHTPTISPAADTTTNSHKPSKYHYKSPVLPYQPPTLQEAYESARLAGRCLQPDADLQQRLRCCTTGLAFYAGAAETYAESADALLLIASSNGDVYAHTIVERTSQAPEERTNVNSDIMMANYAAQICELTQPALNYTDVVDMSAMSKVFRCKLLSANKQEQESDDAEEEILQPEQEEEFLPEEPVAPPKRKGRHLGRWQKSMHSLSQYKDALVPDLLAVWDIEIEKEANIRLTQLNEELRIKPDSETIVNNWLTGNTQEEQPPMSSIPIDNLNRSFKMDISISDDADGGGLTQAFMDASFTVDNSMISMGALPQSTQLTDAISTQMDMSTLKQEIKQNDASFISAKSKSKKKKAKYIKGF